MSEMAVPRIATEEAFNAHPRTYKKAIFGDCFNGIGGARRDESAVCPKKGADGKFIKLDNCNS